MKHIVMIDPHSAFAGAYASLLYKQQSEMSPAPLALPCTEVGLDHPVYLFVRTEPTEKHPAKQSLYIPHYVVLWVIQYAEEDRPLAGFGFGT